MDSIYTFASFMFSLYSFPSTFQLLTVFFFHFVGLKINQKLQFRNLPNTINHYTSLCILLLLMMMLLLLLLRNLLSAVLQLNLYL